MNTKTQNMNGELQNAETLKETSLTELVIQLVNKEGARIRMLTERTSEIADRLHGQHPDVEEANAEGRERKGGFFDDFHRQFEILIKSLDALEYQINRIGSKL